MEYNGFIYWATQSRLHRIAIANADEQWINAVPNWKTFDVTDTEFHPMAIQQSATGPELFIGDGNQIAVVDTNGAFNSNALDLTTPNRVKCMIDYELDILVGTFIDDSVTRAEIIRWDTVSTAWNVSDPVNEVGVNAFIRDDNILLVNAGRRGNIYYYDGEKLERFLPIPGDYSSTKTAYVHPGSVATFDGFPIFGFSNVSGNPTLQGIYSLGSYSRNYDKSLTLDWVISKNVTNEVEVGAIVVVNGLIYEAWKHGNDYGIDRLDTTAKYSGAYFTTKMLFREQRHLQKVHSETAAYYNSLPTGTGFAFSYSTNAADFVSLTSVTNSLISEVRSRLAVPSVGSLQIKCAFTVSGNTAPTMERFKVMAE